MYVERRSHLAPLIVWTRTVEIAGTARVLPDGCMDLIWSGDDLIVAGPDTLAHAVENTPGTRYAAVRCAPGIGPALFGLPAHTLRDRRVPRADVWGGRDVRVPAERLAGAADPAAVLEHLAAERLRDHDAEAARLAGAVVGELRAGVDIATVAA